MTNECAACGKPASRLCSGCIEGVDVDGNLSQTVYCNVDCQKTHFPEHKTFCRHSNARKQLYRGGQLLQKAFLTFAEIGNSSMVSDVWHQDGKINVMFPLSVKEPGPLFRFQTDLFPDEKHKQAMLAFQGCRQALGYMHELMKKVLKGKASEPGYYKCCGLTGQT